MAESKTKATNQKVTDFIDAIASDGQRDDAKTLVKMMQAATGEKPKMWGPSIIGFGSVHYKYESGREGDTPVVGFSPRKSATVLYGLGAVANDSGALSKLGKCTAGKGCLYVKKLSDVNHQVLEALIVKSVGSRKVSRAKSKQPSDEK